MRPPDPKVVELLRNGNGFGKLFNGVVARVRDHECLTLYVLLCTYGPNGARMSERQWMIVARMNRATVREHWAHLEADGLVSGQGGGRGRGNRRQRVPHYPVPQDPSKAPPMWDPPPELVREAGEGNTCPAVDAWKCACCTAPLNRDQYRAGQGVCSDCWRDGRRAA